MKKMLDNVVTKKIVNTIMIYSGYIAITLAAVFFFIKSPIFLTPHNIMNILIQSSVLGVVGCGMTAIVMGGGSHVIRGGIDLSLGNNLALSATITALLLRSGQPFILAIAVSLICSLAVSTVISLVIVKLKLAPLLATLAMMYVLNGVIMVISNNQVVSADNIVLKSIANGSFLGISSIIWIFVITTVFLYILFHKTPYGNRVMATGGNSDAAIAAGLNVDKIVISTYLIAAGTAVLSGLLSNARLSGSVPGMGDIMFLDIILIAYMSPIFSKKAVANIPGAFLSALFVGMLSNGFTLINVPSYWVFGIKGALVLIAVALTTFRRRRTL